jgi:3D (Asp-Asp-Asp) domain-containing protein
MRITMEQDKFREMYDAVLAFRKPRRWIAFTVKLIEWGVVIFLVVFLFSRFGIRITQNYIKLQSHQSMIMEATGYSLGSPYASVTKQGTALMDKGFLRIGDINIFTVAVDPNIIPLGSVIKIDSLGLGYATDTGRLIIGNRIDICFNTMTDALTWGKRDVRVLNLGD